MYNILWMEEVFVLLATSTSGCTPKQYDYKEGTNEHLQLWAAIN